MHSDELRQRFVDYFQRHNHRLMPSASLIPLGDPSVLFTSAGMQQFTPYYVGAAAPPAPRLVSVQRCVRTDDIDEVGDHTHHTFFEMLGHFTFGDYFKREAIAFAYEFVTQELGLPADRLWATIFAGEPGVPRDDEAAAAWQAVGIPAERIRAFGRDENWWGPIGESGPCGPDSEVFLDRGPEAGCGLPLDQCGPNHCERFLEFWNAVFNQYNKEADGTLTPLKRTGIDTGVGFERVAAILQGVPSAYETDLFAPLLAAATAQTGVSYGAAPESDRSLRIIADHLRAATFLVADGVIPSSEGRGYVVRRLIRRAVSQGRLLGSEAPLTAALAEATIERMAAHYPHLAQKRALILRVCGDEEAQFARTYDVGRQLLAAELATVQGKGDATLPGHTAFRLYDTFGFPLPLTEEIAAAHGIHVDTAGFAQRMAEQRARSRAAQRFQKWQGIELPAVEVAFEGYQTTDLDGAQVLWLQQAGEPTSSIEPGAPAMVVLDRTPFYAEGGGQVGDTGEIVGSQGRFVVTDVQGPAGRVIVHLGQMAEGYLAAGDTVRATVDAARRQDTARNHTATHLLHAALRSVLGEQVHQSGSLVVPDRLRFDFSHRHALTPDERQQVERLVNRLIRANHPVHTVEMPTQAALASGALALFDEKYGEQARVVSIGDASRELCGGTHVARTGEIGLFLLTTEGSIGSGLRRVEAVTGRAAEAAAAGALADLTDLSRDLGVPRAEVRSRVQQLQEELAAARRQLAAQDQAADQHALTKALDAAVAVNGVHVLAAEVPAPGMRQLRESGDWLRDHLPGPAVLLLGTVRSGRPQLLVMVPRDLAKQGIHAGELLREATAVMNGKGGGRPEMAQGGGGDPARLAEALAHGLAVAADRLRGENVS